MIANSLSSLALEPFGSSYFQLGGTAATLVELYCFMFTKFIVVTARCSSLRSRAARPIARQPATIVGLRVDFH
jgi:hypothetical protein